jgi:5-methylcytosine-specific restriction endonuclease McrA
MCEREGQTTPSEVVDHIKEVSGPYDPLFWDRSNHQALCFECHEKKHRRKK